MTLKTRIIARLDVKGKNVIKGVQFEGVRVVGLPHDLALKYHDQGADEILFVDAVASLYGRNNLAEIVTQASTGVFVPMTVGGGIRHVRDAERLFEAGADKLAINTAAVANPQLLTDLARKYGSQAVCLSVQAKRREGWFEAMTDGGREKTGRNVLEWVKEAQDRGIGEILLTSIDKDGTFSGLELDLIGEVAKVAQVPLIACGGLGGPQDALLALHMGADAICTASALHYGKTTIPAIKHDMAQAGCNVRLA